MNYQGGQLQFLAPQPSIPTMSVASLPNAAPQTNVAQTNTFNITGADPNAVAAQVENVLKKQNQQAFGALARVQADK